MYACLLHLYDLFSELELRLTLTFYLIRHMTFITRFFVVFFCRSTTRLFHKIMRFYYFDVLCHIWQLWLYFLLHFPLTFSLPWKVAMSFFLSFLEGELHVCRSFKSLVSEHCCLFKFTYKLVFFPVDSCWI